MKVLLILGLLVLASLFCTCTSSRHQNENSINPLLGDISFLNKFGYAPSESTDEDLRIRTHLEYVEEFLRQKNVLGLNQEQQKKRVLLLNLLHDYWRAGVFPKNYDHANKRIPCFIDEKGAICAVGYLIAQTAGREAAEQINTNHKYDRLLVMNDLVIDRWIAASGLSKEECAMIQPLYGKQSNNSYIEYNSDAYKYSSLLIGCANVPLMVANAIQIGKRGNKDKTVPVISLFTGGISLVYGSYNLWLVEHPTVYLIDNNKSQKPISIVNIGIGAGTAILAICNLSIHKQKKNKSLSWNFNSFMAPGKQLGLCVNLTKRI